MIGCTKVGTSNQIGFSNNVTIQKTHAMCGRASSGKLRGPTKLREDASRYTYPEGHQHVTLASVPAQLVKSALQNSLFI